MKPQGPFPRLSPAIRIKGRYFAQTGKKEERKIKVNIKEKKKKKKRLKTTTVKKRQPSDIQKRRKGIVPLTRFASRMLKKSSKSQPISPRSTSPRSDTSTSSLSAFRTDSPGLSADWSLLVEAFSKESVLWEDFFKNLPSESSSCPALLFTPPSSNESETKEDDVSKDHVKLKVFKQKSFETSSNPLIFGSGQMSSLKSIHQFSNQSQKTISRNHTLAPDSVIEFVNIQQYLRDVRHYITQALSGQMVESVLPANSNDSKCSSNLLQNKSIQTDCHSDIHAKSTIITLANPVSDTIHRGTDVLLPNTVANEPASNNSFKSSTATATVQSNSVPSTKNDIISTSTTSINTLRRNKLVDKPSSTKKTITNSSISSKDRNTKHVDGSKVDDHMDSKTMKATRAHHHDYVRENSVVAFVEPEVVEVKAKKHTATHPASKRKVGVPLSIDPLIYSGTAGTTFNKSAEHRLILPAKREKATAVVKAERKSTITKITSKKINSLAKREKATTAVKAERKSKVTKITGKKINSLASRSTLPRKSIMTTTKPIEKKTFGTSKKREFVKKLKKTPNVTVSGSWGRLLTTALGLSEDNDLNNISINESKQQKDIVTPIHSPNVKDQIIKRELYPREAIVMLHLFSLEQLKTHKVLTIVQRIVDGLAGFLLGKHANPIIKKNSNKASNLKKEQVSKKKLTNKKPKHNSAAQMFQKNLSRIENIFLQLPIDISGMPTQLAHGENGCCPRWCDVGIELRPITKSNSNKKTKKVKNKVVLATPILMPIKSSGKCFIPPLEKCLFDFSLDSDENRLGSVGRVVRLILKKDAVEKIKTQLVDYGKMYQNNESHKNHENHENHENHGENDKNDKNDENENFEFDEEYKAKNSIETVPQSIFRGKHKTAANTQTISGAGDTKTYHLKKKNIKKFEAGESF